MGNLLDPVMALSTRRVRSTGWRGPIAYEGAVKPPEGSRLPAEAVMERVAKSPFRRAVGAVVYQGSERHAGCQFTFTCDGSLQRRRLPERMLAAARAIAADAISGALPDLVPGATFYHAYCVAPRWAPPLTRVSQIGAHIFYRAGAGQALDAGKPPFGDYRGADATSSPRRSAAKTPQTFSPWGLRLPKQAAMVPEQTGSLD